MLGGTNEDIVRIWSLTTPSAPSTTSARLDRLSDEAPLRAPLFFGAVTTNHDTVTLELASQVTFKPNSTIHSYLVTKGMPERRQYLVGEILTRIKRNIAADRPFDLRNPAVVICGGGELERAFGCSAIDVTQIRTVLYSQTTVVSTPNHLLKNPTCPRREPEEGLVDQHECYQLNSEFRKVMETVQLLERKLFTFKEASYVLSKYIIKKRKELVEPRNISIVDLTGDPLEKIFDKRHFHRRQTEGLLRKQLEKIEIIEVD